MVKLHSPLHASLKRTAKRLLGRPQEYKFDEELHWQRTEWLPLWSLEANQKKCHEYWRRYRHLDDILMAFPITSTTDVLDVGCGMSSVLHFVEGRRVGLDPLMAQYRKLYRYPFETIVAPGEAIPRPNASFDVVFCSNCIDHSTSPEQLVAEMRRVLRPGGLAVLTCEVFEQAGGERDLAHPHSISAASLRALVAGHFTITAEWNEPFYGLKRYCEGATEPAGTEQILLLRL